MSALQTAFEAAYYPPTGQPWAPPSWRGVPCQKLATDLWALGELVMRLRPGLILELGTAAGGTALFLADVLALSGSLGQVLTVDPAPVRLVHSRVTCLTGDSLDPAIQTRAAIAAGGLPQGLAVLVLLDSDHRAAHVAAELAAYAPLVTVGSYCVVEDTNLGATVLPGHGPGPAGPVAAWVAAHPDQWVVDTAVEPPLTTNPGGYLRRVA